MTRVELFETIRRDKFVHGHSIRAIAKKRGVHRRLVRLALASALPPERCSPRRDQPVLTSVMRAMVDHWLTADLHARPKQRHTAKRIFNRLQNEFSFLGAQSTVRKFVALRRRLLALPAETFVPLAWEPGQMAEVDWYEAQVRFPDGERTVEFFVMRACFSGHEFHMAFPHQKQQAFLEAHVAALDYFGGVFATIRYDNLKTAVQKVLRGRQRLQSARFVALRSHYLFESAFCRPGLVGAHEKGGVEGAVGRFRRNHLVPIPEVDGFEHLNAILLQACQHDQLRCIQGRPEPIATDWLLESKALRALPAEPFPTAEIGTAKVNSKALVTLATNSYSVPVRLAHLRVEFRLDSHKVELLHEGKTVALHPRQYGRHQLLLELDHYLRLLWHKPGALAPSLPLRQARQRGQWPAQYDVLWSRIRERFDEAEAARQMLAVVMMHRQWEPRLVHEAVNMAIEHGVFDAGAICVLVRQLAEPEQVAEGLDGLGALLRYDRPVMDLADYDQLLTRRGGQEVH